ncbi:MAG: IPT/TIG domain-containing protein [Candidatus Firestonebacteria bacterium]|nr:IPT/TIG domain-containing protein [Candidatus Firestonebacteria bacterium]
MEKSQIKFLDVRLTILFCNVIFHKMKSKNKIIKYYFIFIIIFISLKCNITAIPPEIYYIEPSSIPYGDPAKVTVVGKNFEKDLNIFLSSNKMTKISAWNSIQSIEDIYLINDYVFLACGIKGFVILQIKDAFQPMRFIGSLTTNTVINKVFINGNYAYLTDNSKLYIVDIKNISLPHIIGELFLPERPISLYAFNELVYIGYEKKDAQIASVKKPEKPQIIWQFNSVKAYDFMIVDKYLYIASGKNGFFIFDNNNPQTPLLINNFKVSGFVSSLYAENNFIFLAAGKEGIQIYESSNKNNAVFLLKIDIPNEIKYLYKNNNYLYSMSNNEIVMFDVSNISSPKPIKRWASDSKLNKLIASNENLYVIDLAGDFQVLATMWKIKNYRYGDNALIVIAISEGIPFDTYDLQIINQVTKEIGIANNAIKITKPQPKINFINPAQVVIGSTRQITIIGENFVPGAIVKVDTTLCTNIEIFSQAKLKATYHGDFPVGCYDITVTNPDEQSTTYKKGFCIVEKTLNIDSISPESYFDDDNKRNIVVAGKKLDKAEKVVLWGNGPYRVSNCDTPGSALAVFAAQNYCFIADELAGFTVIDISNPIAPAIVGRRDTPGIATGLALFHSWAYIADGEYGIQVLDNSNPHIPSFIWSCDTPGYAYDVLIKNQYLYVADGKAGFSIYFMENPYNLIQIATFKTIGAIYSIAIKDNYMYLASGDIGVLKGDGIVILDITTPEKPKLKSIYQTSGSANALQIVDNYLFAACGEGGLIILDLTKPGDPVYLGGISLKANLLNVFIDSKKEYAYVTSEKKGIYIFDIKFPENPYPVASFKLEDTVNDITIRDNLAYLASSKSGLDIVDISSPLNPMQVGFSNNPDRAIDMATYKDLCYVLDQNKGLVIVNTNNPRFNVEGVIPLSGKPMGIEIKDNFAYITTGNEGLQIFSLEDSKKPSLTSKLPMPLGDAYNICINKNKAYISCVDEGVYIVDIKDPRDIKILGSFKTKDKAYQTFIQDNYAYVADYSKGLFIADISNPILVKEIGSTSTKGYANDVEIKGNYAYIAANDMGLTIIDISNKSDPKFISSCKTEGYANGIKIDGNIAILACGSSGVYFIDISNPQNPMIIANYNTLGTSYNIYIDNKKVYIADNNFGLNVYYLPIIINKIFDQSENSLSFDVPDNISPGAYNISIVDTKEGRVAVKNNVLKIIHR